MSYKIYKNCISERNSKKLFDFIIRSCEFYCPLVFNKREIYKNTWLDKKFIKKMKIFRKNYKDRFSAMYDSIQLSNQFKKIIFNCNLDLIAEKFLDTSCDNFCNRDVQFRMDFPNDSRNSFGWHQDNAYDEYNLSSKNGAVLWIPLIKTNKKNGTLIVKEGSENSTFKFSKKIKKGTKFTSEQILVKEKYLKKV